MCSILMGEEEVPGPPRNIYQSKCSHTCAPIAGKPARVTPVRWSKDSIEFQISRPNYNQLHEVPLYYGIYSRSHVKQNYTTDNVVIDRLEPYENVEIKVSTCYRTSLFKIYICGETLTARGRSGVAGNSSRRLFARYIPCSRV